MPATRRSGRRLSRCVCHRGVPRSRTLDAGPTPGAGSRADCARVCAVIVGILGGTGPLGRGLALRLAAAGTSVTLGSRDPERAAATAAEIVAAWPDRSLAINGA